MITMKRPLGAVAAVVLATSALALASAVLAPSAPAAQLKKVAEKTFDFAPGGEVVIESKNGRIVVEAWDRPSARVQVTRTVRAGDDKQAADLMAKLRADVEIEPGLLTIVSRYPKRTESKGFWDFLGRKVAAMDIHYYLQVPRETALSLETTNGEIRVRGIARDVSASTTNGDVRIAGATGSVEANTTNGAVELLYVAGSVEGQTTNGSIRADVKSLPDKGTIQLSTTNGNVLLSLPSTIGATLEAGTTNGKVTTAFPVTVRGSMSSKSIQGTIGRGGAVIELQTTNGNIEITKSGASAGR